MKVIFSLLCIVLLLSSNDSYHKIESEKFDINIRAFVDNNKYQNLNIFFNGKLIKTYNFESITPSLKMAFYEKKMSYLGILISWRTIHRGLGINGEYYQLDIFKIKDNNSIVPLDFLSKTGFDGQREEGNEVFKYKTKKDVKSYISNILEDVKNHLIIKQNSIYNLVYIQNLIEQISINNENLTQYNDIAYYLEQAKAYKESIYLLEKILEKYPKRTVAYLNISDAYWGDNNKNKAIENYKIYISQMKENGKENKIPKKVFERINIKDIKKNTISKEIQIEKQYLFDNPNKESKTKMYLLKNDKVEILEEKDDWLYILYKGKKDIKAWIPKSAIEETEINQEIKPVSKNIEIKEEKTFFTKLLEFFNISKINQNTKIMQS